MILPLYPQNEHTIIDELGNNVGTIKKATDREYIIKAVNCNDKLVEAFGLARSMVLSGEKMTPQAEEIFEQALKEA